MVSWLSLLRNSSILTPNEARVYYDLPKLIDDVADNLKESIVSNDQNTNVVGDAVAEPKNTDETNPVKGSVPVTDSQTSKTVRSNQDIEYLKREVHKLKTDNGRLRKELRDVAAERD